MRPAAGGGDGEEVLQHVSKLVQALHLWPEDVSHTLTTVLWHFKRDAAKFRDVSVGSFLSPIFVADDAAEPSGMILTFEVNLYVWILY